jgi:site-specific DNA recombinase
MSSKAIPRLRCAIYTRKSSDEGLEQNFNSLHAQREACEAYIRSQSGEGWVLVKTAYDDGGFSGGTMERPALKRLLGDVQAGLVDTIVVYKVDRLTRSLHDFARIVEVFDKAGASFVSITQAFNTTTSMGRLTLNVLLSFAQFEREVTGERIRDKIAQSKAKGMWMGGILPLGYDGGDHTLVINPTEAETVRGIFKRYLELGSVYALEAELKAQGVFAKAWTTRAGKPMGGGAFSMGALYYLLQNHTYRGLIKHKSELHPGLHPAIIDQDLFDAVQVHLAANRIRRRLVRESMVEPLLAGRIFDGHGHPYSPTFSYGREGRIYHYYICTSAAADAPRRLPAAPVEALILEQLRAIAGRPDLTSGNVADLLSRIEVRSADVQLVLSRASLFGADHPDLALEDLQGRLDRGGRAVLEPHSDAVRVSLPVRLSFRGGRCSITGLPPTNGVKARKPDPKLTRALRAAHALWADLGASPLDSDIATLSSTPSNSYLTRLAGLALLAPDIQLDILNGRQPADLSLKHLLWSDPPVCWADQRRWIRSRAGVTAAPELRLPAA